MDNEKNPTPPAESPSGASAPLDEEKRTGQPPSTEAPSQSALVDDLLDAARGEVKPRSTPAQKKTPVTPAAREASAGTRAEAAPPGDAPGKETPAATPTAARVAPESGASKTTSTPTPSINKGVSTGVAAKTPAATRAPAAATAVPAQSEDQPVNKMRRRIIWASVAGFLVTSFLMFVRFFLPRALFEPASTVRLGFPGDYNFGVDTKWQQLYRIWVVKNAERLFVIKAVCTHLGCTPDWKESENKFKCPCHGSGYDSEGINFEGPAPRPMDRAQVALDAEGQILVDTNKLFMWEKGKRNQFDDEGSFIRLA